MCGFFKCHWRTAGCLTLVTACLLMGIWMRSTYRFDFIAMSLMGQRHEIGSLRGQILWAVSDAPDARATYENLGDTDRWELDSLVLLCSIARNRANFRHWIIDYRVAILPLTLLSGYLILWKSRPTPKTADCQSSIRS